MSRIAFGHRIEERGMAERRACGEAPGSPAGRVAEALSGLRATLPILPAIVPFAALYGALATAAGFPARDTLLASATVYAGASQYLMLDMLGQGLSGGAIVLAVAAVNFRHVLYSAALGRHLSRFTTPVKALAFHLMVDPTFAAAEQRARRTGALRPAWYFGYALTVWTVWMAANVAGIASGRLLEDPARYGIDFILPLYFLGVLLGFRGSNGFVGVLATSAAVSVGVHETLGPPWHLAAGALAGLAVAAARSRPPAPDGTLPDGGHGGPGGPGGAGGAGGPDSVPASSDGPDPDGARTEPGQA